MFLKRKSRARSVVAALALFGMKAGAAMAADLPATKDFVAPPAVLEDPRWYARIGFAGIFYDASANVALGGRFYPGGNASIANNAAATFDFGYFVTRNVSLQMTAGSPPTAYLSGAGSISNLGLLGKLTYGPAIASVNYYFKDLGYYIQPLSALQPYLGVGPAYSLIFATHDAAVKNLSVIGNIGFAIQGGAEYFVNRNWSVYADAKHIWLNVPSTAVALGIPANARIFANPTVVSGGVAYHW
jgi:outer membrane protein